MRSLPLVPSGSSSRSSSSAGPWRRQIWQPSCIAQPSALFEMQQQLLRPPARRFFSDFATAASAASTSSSGSYRASGTTAGRQNRSQGGNGTSSMGRTRSPRTPTTSPPANTIGSMRDSRAVDFFRLVQEPDYRGLKQQFVVVGKKLILELQRKANLEPLAILCPWKNRCRPDFLGQQGGTSGSYYNAKEWVKTSSQHNLSNLGVHAHERKQAGFQALIEKHTDFRDDFQNSGTAGDEDEEYDDKAPSAGNYTDCTSGCSTSLDPSFLSTTGRSYNSLYNNPSTRSANPNTRNLINLLEYQFPKTREIIKTEEKPLRKISNLRSFKNELIAKYEFPSNIFAKSLYGERQNRTALTDLPHGKLILALEDVPDPGTLGTILRSALAFQFHGLYFLKNCADPFSPECLRASQGALLHLPFVKSTDFYQFYNVYCEQFLAQRDFAFFVLADGVDVKRHDAAVRRKRAAARMGQVGGMEGHYEDVEVHHQQNEGMYNLGCTGAMEEEEDHLISPEHDGLPSSRSAPGDRDASEPDQGGTDQVSRASHRTTNRFRVLHAGRHMRSGNKSAPFSTTKPGESISETGRDTVLDTKTAPSQEEQNVESANLFREVFKLGEHSLARKKQKGALLLIRGSDYLELDAAVGCGDVEKNRLHYNRRETPAKFTKVVPSEVTSTDIPLSVKASSLLYQIRTKLLPDAPQTGFMA
ncbi:unnamed protein product [Amoebophrya sp. A120]|nr:unnamed protein product [Amoebophrya sp. A120]|eukprot:GSA120T00012487001.1